MSQSNDSVPFRVATFTLSDTRKESDDVGGRLLVDALSPPPASASCRTPSCAKSRTCSASRSRIVCDGDLADAIVLTGGTGIAPRDRTIEVIAPMLDKTIDGFGEAFRRLSWDAIGPRAILSRAIAGVVRGKVVAALPGSPAAVELAVDALLAPTLSHAIALASGRGGHHAKHNHDKPGADGGKPG